MAKHGDIWRSADGKIELRCGRWQDVLADVSAVDAVITDPPYDERTHAAAAAARDPSTMADPGKIPTGLIYEPWTDHRHARVAEDTIGEGRYCFAPVAWVAPGSRVRLLGDGPSNWTCWICVARPRNRAFASWGSLPGAYIETNRDLLISGGKPLRLMRALVRDYSRPGDIVCDPCAGGGTTLLAAAMEGRRAIGSEMDPTTFDLAVDRLRGWGPSMTKEGQANLFVSSDK